MATTGGPASGQPTSGGPGSQKDLAKDGLLSIAPRDAQGAPTLGGIPLVKKLGQGGMGAVYLGKHPRLGVEVAVKVLPFHLADQDPNTIQYFMREAQAMARLNHNNLVRIYDVNVDGDPAAGSAIWFLVMEYVSGRSAGSIIRERIKQGLGPLPENEALELLIASAEGLAAAHDERFVHRDIKPDNIMVPVGADGIPQWRKAKMMDLGLAKPHDDNAAGLTGTNVAMGTPGYMAPEQAENAKEVAPTADIFSMGGTLYTMLSGTAPFQGNTVLNVLKKTTEEPHVPIRQVNPNVSEPTAALIDTCLAKKPSDRYQNAGFLRDALKVCLSSLESQAAPEMTLMSLKNIQALKPAVPYVAPASDIATVRATPSPGVAPSDARPVPAPAAKGGGSKALLGLAAGCLVLVLGAGVVGGVLWFRKGEDPEKLRQAAVAAENSGDFDGALAAYEKVLKARPGDAGATGAIERIRARKVDADYERHLQVGTSAYNNERWGDAEAAFEKAVAVKDTPDARKRLEDARRSKAADADFLAKMKEGDDAMDADRFALAEQAYRSALDKKRTSKAAEEGLARAKAELAAESVARDVEATAKGGAAEKAWDKARDGLKKHEGSYVLRMAAARLGLDGLYGWYGDAIADAERASQVGARPEKVKAAKELKSQLEGRRAEAEKTAGVLKQIEDLVQKGDYDAAEKLLSGADSKNKDAYKQRIKDGKAWKKAMDNGGEDEGKGKLVSALEEYKKALGLRATDAATVEAVRRTEEKIAKAFDEALAQSKQAAMAFDFSAARDHCSRASKLKPGDARLKDADLEIRVQECLGDAKKAEDAKRLGDALTALKRALDLREDPDTRRRYDNLMASSALQAAFAAVAEGNRAEGLRLAREAAKSNPSNPELAQLEEKLWPDLLAEKAAVDAAPYLDTLLLARDGRVVGAGRGYRVFAPEDLATKHDEPISAGYLYAPTLLEEGGLSLIGPKAVPSENAEAPDLAIWAPGGAKPVALAVGEMTVVQRASRVARLEGGVLVRSTWTSGGSAGTEPDYYSVDLWSPDGKGGGAREICSAQGHLVVAVAPGGSAFATAGGIYRTYRAARKVEERKLDTNVYLWTPQLQKRAVDLGQEVGAAPVLAWTADGRRLVVGTESGRVFVVNADSGAVEARIDLASKATALSCCPDKPAAAAVSGGKVVIFDLAGGWTATPAGIAGAKSALFSSDGKSLYVGGEDGKLRRYARTPLVPR